MNFRNGLSIWERTSRGFGSWTVASFHSPHSLTWRWSLHFDFPRRDEGRWFFFQHSRLGQEKWCLFFLKFRLGWSTQEPMWFRDLYWRLSDERAQREGLMWLSDDHPHKVHA